MGHPKPAEGAARLRKCTFTNLYNQRSAWLDLAHRKLDEAVSGAYGWDPGLSDEALLEKLLALNGGAAGWGRGVFTGSDRSDRSGRWLRQIEKS